MNCILEVEKWIKEKSLINPGSRVIAAVSGGADSMAMLTILRGLKDKLNITLGAAHLDHGIRKVSKDEKKLVADYCKKINIPLISALRDTPAAAVRKGKGIEETARILRYEFLKQSAEEFRASVVALGHNQDDQTETILHHIIRGSGLRGLMGIPEKRGIFIRPVLCCSGKDLEQFLKTRNIRFATDKSNLDISYTRNRIRKHLLPMLRDEFNPSIDKSLIKLAENISEGFNMFSSRVERIAEEYGEENRVKIPLEELKGISDFEIYLLIDTVLKNYFDIHQDIEKCHFDAAKSLLRSCQSGRKINLPHGITITLEQIHLRISKDTADNLSRRTETTIPESGEYDLPSWNLTVNIEKLSGTENLSPISSDNEAYLGSVFFPIRIRERKQGDRIRPFGMRGSKKLSDIMIDNKISLSVRNRIPVFEDKKGIIWIPGVTTDERTRISKKTEQIIRIKLTKHN
ncbi:MAG: tRNA lysidine(34) synthetase TilS [Candidatus Krumholzibacteriota bacterium]|nr:tRNA lysidine(34) synthetase TilS [Candidatus Krumholzibacteriota bacterium]